MSRLFVTIAGRRWEFSPGQQVMIGRDPGCAVVVDDPRVSRSHLSIIHDPRTGWVAADAGSIGGMFVNGERLPGLTVDRRVEVRLSNPEQGPLVTLELEAVASRAPIPPGLGPTLLPPSPHQQTAPVGTGHPRPAPPAVLALGTILLVVGYLVAALGTIGSLLLFGVDVDGTYRAYEFLTALGLALGVGAAAVAAGSYLRMESRR